MTDFGFPMNPSSSASIPRVKYRHLADNGISKNASLKTIDFANILRSAIVSPFKRVELLKGKSPT